MLNGRPRRAQRTRLVYENRVCLGLRSSFRIADFGAPECSVSGHEYDMSRRENPYISDTRWVSKESGKEVQRSFAALLPDGKAVVIYSSGITPDGKAFSNVGYFKKAD